MTTKITKILSLTEKTKWKMLGLMSGTSCDGLDIALIEICGSGIKTQFEFIAGKSFPYTKAHKAKIMSMMQQQKRNALKLSPVNFYLASLWAELINLFLNELNLNKRQVDLIGRHGQTIWHQPEKQIFIDKQISSTLQLGDPGVLAQLTANKIIVPK